MLSRAVTDIITSAVEAVVRPERWLDLVDQVNACFGFYSSSLVILGRDHETRIPIALSQKLRDVQWEILQSKLLSDAHVLQTIEQRVFEKPAGELLEQRDMFPPDTDPLPSYAFRDWMLEAHDVDYHYTLKLNDTGPWVDGLFPHARVNRPVTEGNRMLLNRLSPLIAGSVRNWRVMEQLRMQFQASLSFLDNLGIAALLCLDDGAVIHRNERSNRLLDAKDGIALNRRGRLKLGDDHSQQSFDTACYELNRTARGSGIQAERSITIERPSGATPYLMIVSPIVDVEAELQSGLRCAMVLIVDPEDRKAVSVDGLVQLGRLTRTEAAVCALLVEGQGTDEIAERRNISENTTRQHIKSILNKLHCHNRVQLLRLAVDTRLPISCK